ncbi:MAG: SEC-C metal-binding domain-containing protein [candidate division WOR-3 bacterium]|nr:SEC-C metal-binding domain-containing protein [candidate division WOR-3 bacterium]
MSQIGRNDPCPCGSGKKYKKCCLVNTNTEFGFEEFVKGRLVQDLLKFAYANYNIELHKAKLFFHQQMPTSEKMTPEFLQLADINFWDWVVYDWVIDTKTKKTLIDLYIESGTKLTAEDLKVLDMMKKTYISLYEVQEVFPEKGMILKDLLLENEYTVQEKLATRSMLKWNIFATRLLSLDKKYIISGCNYPYPITDKSLIVKNIKKYYRNYLRKNKDGSWQELLKKDSHIFIDIWYASIANQPPLILQTTTNEALIFSKATYTISDIPAVLSGLKTITEFENIKDEEFIWEDLNQYGEKVIFGKITIQSNKLIFETNSKERLDKGKEILNKKIGDFISHQSDEFQEPIELLKPLKDMSKYQPKNEIPLEIEQELYNKAMREHYEKWLHQPIPALNNKTPLQSVKTKKGKIEVVELLKQLENQQEYNKQQGRPYFDVKWLWNKLNLTYED